MDKQNKAVTITADTVVSELVAITEKGKLAIAKALSKAIDAGITATSLERKWKAVSPDALGKDAITKHALAYKATTKGADFATTLKALNNGELKRESVAEWLDKDGVVYPEFQATDGESPKSKSSGNRADTDPIKASEKALNALIARVKADKLTTKQAFELLSKTLKELEEFAKVSGNLKRMQ